MDQQPTIDIVTRDNTAVLNITGDVTSFAEEPVMNAYSKASQEGSKNILLKFQEATYINSAGIAIIIGMMSDAQKAKQRVAVCGLSNHFKKIFDMIGLVDYLELYDDEQQALDKLNKKKR